MDEIQLYRMQEDAAFGAWLIESIAKTVGVDADPKRIDKAIYKGTSCGAWVRFDADGIKVGTIVEGSDAEFAERIDLAGIEPGEDGEKELARRFWEAVQACEDFANEAWAEMEAERDD